MDLAARGQAMRAAMAGRSAAVRAALAERLSGIDRATRWYRMIVGPVGISVMLIAILVYVGLSFAELKRDTEVARVRQYILFGDVGVFGALSKLILSLSISLGAFFLVRELRAIPAVVKIARGLGVGD